MIIYVMKFQLSGDRCIVVDKSLNCLKVDQSDTQYRMVVMLNLIRIYYYFKILLINFLNVICCSIYIIEVIKFQIGISFLDILYLCYLLLRG